MFHSVKCKEATTWHKSDIQRTGNSLCMTWLVNQSEAKRGFWVKRWCHGVYSRAGLIGVCMLVISSTLEQMPYRTYEGNIFQQILHIYEKFKFDRRGALWSHDHLRISRQYHFHLLLKMLL